MYQRNVTGKGCKGLLDPTEVKLFLFFFVTYALFVHWIGWNEYSRFDLTRAIVDEGKLEIDTFHNNTGDSAYYKGHYYSDKAPGMSFLAAPVYFFAKHFFSDYSTPVYISSNITSQKNVYDGHDFSKTVKMTVRIFSTVNIFPSVLELNSMFLVTIFTSVLFSSAGVILIYRISRFFIQNDRQRIFASFVYGLGTLIFPYATVFFEHSTATFFAIASFYFIFMQQKKIYIKKFFISGLLAGIGVMVSYINLLVTVPIVIYTAFIYRKKLFAVLLPLIAGFVIGVAPLIIYNIFIFGNLSETSYNYVAMDSAKRSIKILLFDPPFSEEGKVDRLVTLFSVKPLQFGAIMPRLLFMPYRGLFFYYPILFFSVAGLYWMRKRNRAEMLTILSMFILVLLFNTFYNVWWGGGSFGPRYMTVLMPFLMIPLFVAMEKIKTRHVKVLFILMFLISVFHNMLGMQTFDDISFQDDDDIKARLNSFNDLGNPLYEYYLPLFLDNGPRSHIIENVFDERPGVDIRDLNPTIRQGKLFFLQPSGYVLVDLRLLKLMIPMLVFVAFCHLHKKLIGLVKNRQLELVFCSVFVFMSVLLIDTSYLFYSNDWNPQGVNETNRWLAVNGTVYFYSSTSEKFLINITAASFFKPYEISLILNCKFAGNYKILPQSTSIITDVMDVHHGENVIRMNSDSGCIVPFNQGVSGDKRCLSVNLISMDKIFLGMDSILYAQRWYPPERNGRWMIDNSTIYVIRNRPELMSMNLSFSSYAENNVSIVLNGRMVDIISVSPENIYMSVYNVEFVNGVNKLQLITESGCKIPAVIENSSDDRCLSLFLRDLNVYSR